MSEASLYRIMRLILIFDMPVTTKEQRREYAKFRDYIMDDGFLMLQFSVYTRVCPNDTSVEKHVNRVKAFDPKFGNIRIIKVTENQFINMVMVHGDKLEQEKTDLSDDLVII